MRIIAKLTMLFQGKALAVVLLEGTFMDANPYCSTIHSLTNPTGSAPSHRLRLKLRCENRGGRPTIKCKKLAPRVHAAQLPAGRVIYGHKKQVRFRRKLMVKNCKEAIFN